MEKKLQQTKPLALRLPETSDYDVGFRKPPVQTRFKPGQSGNPGGRPRGVKRSPMPSLAEERIKTLIMEEAYRTISIVDKGRRLDIPIIAAVLRTLAMNAINNRAAYVCSTLVSKTEADNKKLAMEGFASSLNYKDRWTKELERRKRLNLKLPDPIPHPDDIVLDARNGTFRIAGPMTRDEIPRYQLAAQMLEAYDLANLDIAAKIEASDEGEHKKKLERKLVEQTELASQLRLHYGPRSERTKDPLVRQVEDLIGIPFEMDDDNEDDDEDENQ